MKRTVGIVVGVVAVGVAALVGGRLWGQQTQPTYTPPVTKVGVVNLEYVLKNYNKAKVYTEELKAEVRKAYEEPMGDRKKRLEDLAKQGTAETDIGRKEQLQAQFKALQREVQDIEEAAKIRLTKKQDAQVTQLYTEVYSAVEAYARTADLELVMQYRDMDGKDFFNPVNAQRKLGTGPLLPIWWKPGMDISQGVLDYLNKASGAVPGTPVSSTGGTR